MKVGEIWVQIDNGSRWKIIAMGGGYAFWNSDVREAEDITPFSDEGVTIECIESKPPAQPMNEADRILLEIFGEREGYDEGYIYDLDRESFLQYYRKEYS